MNLSEFTIRDRLRSDELQAQHDSDVYDLVTAHVGGYIDLTKPTPYPPGTREKRAVLAARYRLGAPLFVEGDSLDWTRYGRDA